MSVVRADRCKDRQEKVNINYIVEYSKYTKGWGLYIPSTKSIV